MDDKVTVMIGMGGLVLGYVLGANKPVDYYPEVIKRLKITSDGIVMTPVVILDRMRRGKHSTTYICTLMEVDGSSTEVAVEVWGNLIEVVRMTWAPVLVYFDNILKSTMPPVTVHGTSVGYCSFQF